VLGVLRRLSSNPKPGQEKLLAQLCCEGDKKYIGAEFVLRNAAGRLNEVIKFEDKVADGSRVIDIVLNSAGKEIRQECKSWMSFSTKYYSRTIKEFATDLRDVVRLEDMQWVFDAKGLFTRNARGRAYLKEQFIKMLQTQEGKDALNGLPLDKLSMLFNGYDEAVGVTNSQIAGFINQHFDLIFK
jgi:hypothetical protein